MDLWKTDKVMYLFSPPNTALILPVSVFVHVDACMCVYSPVCSQKVTTAHGTFSLYDLNVL